MWKATDGLEGTYVHTTVEECHTIWAPQVILSPKLPPLGLLPLLSLLTCRACSFFIGFYILCFISVLRLYLGYPKTSSVLTYSLVWYGYSGGSHFVILPDATSLDNDHWQYRDVALYPFHWATFNYTCSSMNTFTAWVCSYVQSLHFQGETFPATFHSLYLRRHIVHSKTAKFHPKRDLKQKKGRSSVKAQNNKRKLSKKWYTNLAS